MPRDREASLLSAGYQPVGRTSLIVGLLAEHDLREHPVALDVTSVARLAGSGHRVLLEYGPRTPASFLDWEYIVAGASLTTRTEVQRISNILPVLRLPAQPVLDRLRSGQVLIGLIDPMNNLESIVVLAQRGVTVVALDLSASAFEMYGTNMVAALGRLAPSGVIAIDADDEIHRTIVVCHGGEVTSLAIRATLKLDLPPRGASPLRDQVSTNGRRVLISAAYHSPQPIEDKQRNANDYHVAPTGQDPAFTAGTRNH